MEEATIRGLVQGGMFVVLILAIWGVCELMTSPSEGARRVRLAIYAALGLFVLVFIQQVGGYAGVAISLALTAVGYWVYRGFKS